MNPDPTIQYPGLSVATSPECVDHSADEHCIRIVDRQCLDCGVSHSAPGEGCDECGGLAFHRAGCSEGDGADEKQAREALAALEAQLEELRPTLSADRIAWAEEEVCVIRAQIDTDAARRGGR